MPPAPRRRNRRSIRLKGHDYSSPGAYFFTVCCADRRPLFGRVEGGEVSENRLAGIVRRCWEDLPTHYPHASLDAFVIMPNHVHGVIVLHGAPTENPGHGIATNAGVGAGLKPAPTGVVVTATGVAAPLDYAPRQHGLPEILRAFKTFSARRINAVRGTAGAAVWQRGYYESIVRDERALGRVREYVRANPQNWRRDHQYPSALKRG